MKELDIFSTPVLPKMQPRENIQSKTRHTKQDRDVFRPLFQSQSRRTNEDAQTKIEHISNLCFNQNSRKTKRFYFSQNQNMHGHGRNTFFGLFQYSSRQTNKEILLKTETHTQLRKTCHFYFCFSKNKCRPRLGERDVFPKSVSASDQSKEGSCED